MRKIENASMKKYTTYKTGGNVKRIYFPSNKEELILLLKKLREENIKFFIMGNGSNLIVDDRDFSGVIINLKDMNNYYLENNELYCECGVMLPVIANKMINEALGGLEWAISIPGTIGASIFNNAGAYGVEMADVVSSVTILDENYDIKTLNNEECGFEYRDSNFKKTKKYIILSCIINLNFSNKEEMLKRVEDRRQRRLASQPLEYPSAGSVFRNPSVDNPAGKLIEELGLKGYFIGGAKISEKHANFIINTGCATSSDIKSLIKLVQDKVYEKYNIELKLEQEIINWE